MLDFHFQPQKNGEGILLKSYKTTWSVIISNELNIRKMPPLDSIFD